MWTTLLASYAAVVSTISLAIAYLAYKSDGPQLSGDAEIHGRYDIQGPTLHVAVYNRGRGPATIESLDLAGIARLGTGGPEEGRMVVGWPLHVPRGALPSRVEGNSGERWHFPAVHITKEWLTRDDLARLEVTIGLANGKDLTVGVDTSNIDVLDGSNLPEWEPDHFKGRSELG